MKRLILAAAILLLPQLAIAQTCGPISNTYQGPNCPGTNAQCPPIANIFQGDGCAVLPPPPPPTVSLSATPSSVTQGQSTTLSWSSTNAISCAASNGWSGTQPISGSLAITPPATSTYSLTCAGAGGSASASASVTVNPPGANACGMQLGVLPAAFCDTFDAPAGIGNRSGDLNGTIWGVSRWAGDMNFGTSYSVPWVNSTMRDCSGNGPTPPGQSPPTVVDHGDIIICNGQMRESTNDNATGNFEAGNVTSMTLYPKQPFDFAGRTGTISFDVTNDSQGTHGAWPELWVTDTPRPAPFVFQGNQFSIPANGFGLRFSATVPAGQGGQIGSFCLNDNNPRWTFDSAVVIRNFVTNDTQGYGTGSAMAVTRDGCVIAPTGPNGGLNHVEVQVSQNQIDVYATDAGTTTPLIHIATVSNANLTLTRGLVWIEDAHYNADKSLRSPLQHDHTFTWDNFAFDGPVVPRDLSFDVMDSLTDCHDGTKCLGWQIGSSDRINLTAMPMTTANISAASGAAVMFNGYFQANPTKIYVKVNGHQYTKTWSATGLPFNNSYTTLSLMLSINKADLVAGANTLQIWSDATVQLSNVNIVLPGAGG